MAQTSKAAQIYSVWTFNDAAMASGRDMENSWKNRSLEGRPCIGQPASHISDGSGIDDWNLVDLNLRERDVERAIAAHVDRGFPRERIKVSHHDKQPGQSYAHA